MHIHYQAGASSLGVNDDEVTVIALKRCMALIWAQAAASVTSILPRDIIHCRVLSRQTTPEARQHEVYDDAAPVSCVLAATECLLWLCGPCCPVSLS